MCDVRKTAVRLILMGLAAGLLAGALAPAKAQTKKKRQQEHARRETNASRLARIQRTTEETYAHRYEVIGGGGYLRFKSGESTRRNNEISWATAVNYYLNPRLALVGDARGSFGHAYQEQGPTGIGLQYPQIPRPQINEYFFMGGASYRFYAKEKIAVSVQGLGGVGWGIFSSGGKGLSGPDLGLWNDGVKPEFSVGVSADYNIYPTLALRFTPTYVGTTFQALNTTTGATTSKIQNNVGFDIGVVYRFGHR